MANLNLADPAAISAVYSSILDNDNNWLLLRYETEAFDEIGLHSYGGQGLEELKTKISDLDDIFIAFYREELDKNPGYVIINYIPPAVSAVKRARVLVHARRVGAILKQHQAIFTVDSLSLITTSNVHKAIRQPETAFQSVSLEPSPPPNASGNAESEYQAPPARRLPSAPIPVEEPQSVPRRPLQPLRGPSQISNDLPSTTSMMGARSPLTSASREGLPQAVPLFPKGSFTHAPSASDGAPPQAIPLVPRGFLSSLIKRKKKRSVDSADDVPPPIPPKSPPTPPKVDYPTAYTYPTPMGHSYSQPPPQSSRAQPLRNQRSHSFSEFAMISHPDRSDGEDMVIVEPESSGFTLPLKGKWAAPAELNDSLARAERRRELKSKREQEEREVREQEARRQRKLKAEKEANAKVEAERERRRRLDMEEEIRVAKERRRKKEQQERDEEEKKQRELEERRRLNRARRLHEHKRLELWREEQARKEEASALQAEEARLRQDTERRERIQQVASKLKGSREDTDLSGWITILNPESLAWKRRYYKFVGSKILLYRSPTDTQPLDQAHLKDNIQGLKEWDEGYEDLESIPHSFVVEFIDNSEVWSMYADSEAEKYKILGLLKISGAL